MTPICTIVRFAYPTSSNRLASIATGSVVRRFTYDASGDIATDGRSGALGLTFQYDEEGRLVKTYQTSATANGATYVYDAQSRLSACTVTQSTTPTTTTTLYVHDQDDHIVAELNGSGQTLKEYIWLGDLPVAVVDAVNTATPTLYFVHVDHLMRPVRMTDGSGNQVWSATYAPFGATTSLVANPEVMNGRFPGQWFQLETGLAYNWHRHYDPTIGRYIQPDPLVVDDGDASVRGLAGDQVGTRALVNAGDGHATAGEMGWQQAHDIIMSWPSSHPMLQDGPSVYGYAGQAPTNLTDKTGLVIGGFSPLPRQDKCALGPAQSGINPVAFPSLCDNLGKVGDLCIYICGEENNSIMRLYAPFGLTCPKLLFSNVPGLKNWGP